MIAVEEGHVQEILKNFYTILCKDCADEGGMTVDKIFRA